MLALNDASKLIEEGIASLVRSGTLPEGIAISDQMVLLGKGSSFDSLGFITLVTEIEDRLEKVLGKEVFLALDEISGFSMENPSLTIPVLAKYLVQLSAGGRA